MTRLYMALWLLGCLAFVAAALWPAMQDNHRRGMARVQRGTSWTPKGQR